MDMQRVRCNLCGADNPLLVLEGPDRLHHLPGAFRLVRCAECGLIYQNPQLDPQEVLSYYPSDYHSYYIPVAEEKSWFRRFDRRWGVKRRCLAVQKRVRKTGRLLDVGCGTGAFLQGMHALGWQVYGSDLNPEVVRYTHDYFGFDVREGELAEIGYPAGFFDVVTMWDVLEHVHDPRGTLAEVARILKPGGWIIMNTPNPAGWDARLFGMTWAGWDIPRHLFLISPTTMQRYLQETGFGPAEIFSFTGRHGALMLNLQLTLEERVRNRQLRRLLLALAGSLPVRLASWPFHRICEQFNQSLTYTAAAQTMVAPREGGDGEP
jgi:SAM-dependent methyltransferase